MAFFVVYVFKMTDDSNTTTAVATMQLANKESHEHMIGMEAVYQEFRNRPMIICAHRIDSSAHPYGDSPPIAAATTTTTTNNTTGIKTIHFIRHGQGFHNLLADIATESGLTWQNFENSGSSDGHYNNPYMRPEVVDAPLTELGRKQAQQLQHQIITQQNSPMEYVFVSPHCRTLQTGLIAFQHCLVATAKSVPPMIAHELLREESGIHVCDQRRTISWQSVEFPQYDFQTYCPSDIDPLFHSETRETKAQVAHRIYEFMEYISELEDASNIAVVTHSGWLHILFNAIVQNDCHPKLKEWFQTGEMRSVQFEFIRN
jgi:broad specificity phosphatase PhoE